MHSCNCSWNFQTGGFYWAIYPALSSHDDLLPEHCLWSLPVWRPGCSMAWFYSLLWKHFWNRYFFVFWETRFIGKVISFIWLFGSFGKNGHSCGFRVPSLHLFSACLVFPCLKALLRESRPAHFVLFGCYVFFQTNRVNTCTCAVLWRLVFFCGDLCVCFSKIQNKNNKTNFRPNICILALVYGNLTASRFFGKSPGLIWSTSLFLRGKIKICFTSYIRSREKPYGE